MNQKIQKKYIQKALRILSKENSSKITTFKELAKAMKTTDKTIYTYSLNKCEKIIEILHKNSAEKKTEKIVKKLPRKNVKKRTKLPIKNDEDKRLRSYEEIKAKLFAYKAYKTKFYNQLSKSGQILIDRQIWILEWVMKQDNGGENANISDQ